MLCIHDIGVNGLLVFEDFTLKFLQKVRLENAETLAHHGKEE